MIRIDDTLLEEIGLISLPKTERDQLLRQIYETLEMRVGMKLAERMSEQQLDEFERFIDTNDEAGALKWLETNFPDYKQVVADELEKLKVEIKRDAPQLVEAIRQGALPQQGTPSAQPIQSQSAVEPQYGAQPIQSQSAVEPQYGAQPQQNYSAQPSYPSQQPQMAAPQFPPAPSSTQPMQPQAAAAQNSQDFQSGFAAPSAQTPAPAQPLQPYQQQAPSYNSLGTQSQADEPRHVPAQQTGSIPPPPTF